MSNNYIINSEQEWETVPAYVPHTSAAVVYPNTCHINGLHFINTSGNAVTVTVADQQGTPVPIIPVALSIAAGADVVYNFPAGRLAKGGFTWVASAASAVYGYAIGTQY